MDWTHASDEALLAATAEDAEAFGAFYRRHVQAMLAYLVYRTSSGETAVELCSEVFAAALGASKRFKAGKTPARAWLFGIANKKLAESARRRTIVKEARRRMHIEPIAFTDEQYERVEELVDLERRTLPLLTLVGDLPESQQQAVVSRIVQERPYREIAKDGGVSEQVVRQRVSRGLARLAAWSKGASQ